MTDSATGTREAAHRETAEELAGMPSRVEEREPKVARTIGLIGLFFILFAVLMMVWNWAHTTYEWSAKGWPWHVRFSANMIALWCLLGGVGTLYHAFQDRDTSIRRAYGFLSYALLIFGVVVSTVSIVIGWMVGLEGQPPWLAPTIAGVAAGLLALIVVGCTAAPFVLGTATSSISLTGWQDYLLWPVRFVARWRECITSSNTVQQVTVAGIFAAGVFIAAALLMQGINLLPYGLGALGIGFLYLIPYGVNEREVAWRDTGLNLFGAIGAIAVLVTLASSVTDLFGLPSIVMPYGAVAVCVGFPFLCAFIGLKGADSETGYFTARALVYVGVALFLIALVRSLTPAIARHLLGNEEATQYLLPSGFFLMLIGGVYALLGGALASDNRVLVMMRRELGAFFYSPVAFAILTVMAIVAWLAFFLFLFGLQQRSTMLGTEGQIIADEPLVRRYLQEFIPLIANILLIPLLTMRLLSEEKRTGTMEVLLVAPVTEWQIVLSKFFAVWVFNLMVWSLWAVFPLALRFIGGEPFDYRPLLSYYVGLACTSAGFLSMGLFFSSITRNQVVAGLITGVVMLFFLLIVIFYWIFLDTPSTPPAWREALGYVSYYHHLEEFVQGRVHLRFVLFHLSLTAFWLFLTVKVLEARKWR